jgi:nickel-dependent lactate racemase
MPHRVPFGDGFMTFDAPAWADVDVLESSQATPIADVPAAVRAALRDPLGRAPLREFARRAASRASGRRPRVVIAVTDLTRASPDALLVPPMLEELRAGGLRDDDIAICVAVGLHRATTESEKREKLGEEVVRRHEVFDSDGLDATKWSDLGEVPPYGVRGFVQKRLVDADLLLATGVVEPHQYAGWSGGRKTVAIGCSGEPVIQATHGLRFILDPGVRLAKLAGNPFHETATEIARRAGLAFCVNVVNDDQERVIAVAAGEPTQVLTDLVRRAEPLFTKPITKQYDIAIGGVGHPKDVNLYQASRAATYLRFAPVPAVREGGAIIVPAPCPEGAGQGAGERRFHDALASAPSAEAVVERARVHFTAGEQRSVMVALTLQHCALIIAGCIDRELPTRMLMRSARDVQEALVMAHEHIGRPARASVLLVPRAVHTLPVLGATVAA